MKINPKRVFTQTRRRPQQAAARAPKSARARARASPAKSEKKRRFGSNLRSVRREGGAMPPIPPPYLNESPLWRPPRFSFACFCFPSPRSGFCGSKRGRARRARARPRARVRVFSLSCAGPERRLCSASRDTWTEARAHVCTATCVSKHLFQNKACAPNLKICQFGVHL